LKVTCMLCRTEEVLSPSDRRYIDFKSNKLKSFICKKCNQNMKHEAQVNVDFNPDMLDPKGYDKLV
jgi:uncharacterized protein YlaI